MTDRIAMGFLLLAQVTLNSSAATAREQQQTADQGQAARHSEEELLHQVNEVLAAGPPALPDGLGPRDQAAAAAARAERLRRLLASGPSPGGQGGEPAPVASPSLLAAELPARQAEGEAETIRTRESPPGEPPMGRPSGYDSPDLHALIRQLGHPDVTERLQAANELGMYGSAAVGAIPALIGALGDPDAPVRMAAAECIADIGMEPEVAEAALPLVRTLEDASPLVRRAAALALGEVGYFAYPEAVAALIRARADEDARVREAAAEALEQLGAE